MSDHHERRNTDGPTDADRRGEIIAREMKRWRVAKWLDGSQAKTDRPTREELEAEGYMVVRERLAEERRWWEAVDDLLNSGTLHPYMEDFFAYVDGEITRKRWMERRPS